MSELIKRVLVAVVGIPLAVFIIYLGDWTFVVLVAIISALGYGEYAKMQKKKNAFPMTALGIILGVFMHFSFYYLLSTKGVMSAGYMMLLELICFVLLIMIIELWHKKPNTNLNFSATLTGLLYVSLSFLFLIALREIYRFEDLFISGEITDYSNILAALDKEAAGFLILGVFTAIWVCDSAAYFLGKLFGKHKLFERISPKKTWEGAISGFVFAIIASVVYMHFIIPQLALQHAIVIGVIAGTLGQIGDLAESQLKRDAQVKDSSNLIPGHGGILDRFDSIIFVVPTVYIYLVLNIL